MEAVRAIVRRCYGLTNSLERLKRGHGTKHLAAIQLLRRRNVLDVRGFVECPVAPAAADDRSPSGNGLADPLLDTLSRILANKWPKERVLVERVPSFELAGPLSQSGLQVLIDLLVDEDSLHANAALPGLIESANSDAIGGVV